MDIFYAIKEPVSQAFARIIRQGHRIIPAAQKGIFITLFFIIFATVAGVGIVVPLLPIYAHDLGAAGIYVAMIFGAFSISRTFLLPLFGRLSDHKGRKPFIAGGLLTYVLVSLAFVWSTSVNQLIFIRFIQGAGSAMIMPVVQAYVGEISPEGTEGYSMGLFNLSMFLSLSLGPLLGGAILDAWSMDGAFICMAGLSAAGLILCLKYLPPLSEERINTRDREPVSLKDIIRDWDLIGLVVFRYAYTACIGVIWCFLPLFASKTFGISGAKIGVLVMVGVLVSGVLQVPMGLVADRMSRRVMIFSGGLISSAGIVCLYWCTTFWELFAAVFLFGIGGGISMPAISALAVIKGEAKKAMGSVMSIMTVSHSMGMLTGALMAGLSMDFFTLSYAFPCGFAIMVTGTLLFPVLYRARA
ncbi:MAG TPA: MFS transporter [Desulfobacteraceae bacterium]|nr:MFS transporter [Desulfobacteraceae bacterium]